MSFTKQLAVCKQVQEVLLASNDIYSLRSGRTMATANQCRGVTGILLVSGNTEVKDCETVRLGSLEKLRGVTRPIFVDHCTYELLLQKCVGSIQETIDTTIKELTKRDLYYKGEIRKLEESLKVARDSNASLWKQVRTPWYKKLWSKIR